MFLPHSRLDLHVVLYCTAVQAQPRNVQEEMTSVVAINSSRQQQSSFGGQQGSYGQLPYSSNQCYVPAPAPANMAAQQQSNDSVRNMVVSNQPWSEPPAVATVPSEKPNPSMFIVSLILMSVCTCMGSLHLLVCFVPAVILSVVGFNYGYSKSPELQRQSRTLLSVALGLNIAAVVVYCLSLVIIAILVGLASGCPDVFAFGFCPYAEGN